MAKHAVESVAEVSLDMVEKGLIRVLHVDDESNFLKSAKQCLEMQGVFEVETASSVEEAMKKIKEKTFDVIVADCVMPGKDGLEFLKELRDNGNNIPFIVFTGKGREEVAIRALNLGADRYFNKFGHPETVYGELAHGIRQAMKTRQAEEALRKSEERHRNLLENARDTIMTLDLNGNITYVNRVVEEYGFKKDEIIGKSMAEFVPEKYWPRTLKDFEKVIQGKTAEGEIELITPKGKIISEYKSNPIRRGNKIIGSQTILRDVDERKKMEEALRRSEEKYLKLFASSPIGTALLDLEGRYLEVNEAYAKILGVSKKGFVGRKATELTEEAESRKTQDDVNELLARGFTEGVRKLRIFDRNIILSYVNTLLYDKEKKPVAFISLIQDITERKKTEESLRESEERYRELTESIKDVFFAMDKNLRYTYWNKASEELTGISATDAIGKSLTEVFPDVKGTKVEKFYLDILRTKQHQTLVNEYRVRDKDLVFEIDAYPAKDGLSVFVKDITERRKSEEALRESEERFRSIFEIASDCMIYLDMSGRILDVNRKAVAVFGGSKEELLGKHFAKVGIFPLRDIPTLMSSFAKLLAGKQAMVNISVTNKKGQEIPLECSGSSTKMSARFPRLLIVARDVTERKRAEEALKESEEKYRSIVELAPVAISTLDLKGVVTSCNAFTAISGYPKDEIIGKHFSKIGWVRLRDLPQYLKVFKSIIRGKVPKPFEISYRHKNGELRAGRIHVSLMKRRGKTIGLNTILMDITELKKREGMIRESQEKFQRLFTHNPEAAVHVDSSFHVLDVNPRFEELFGYSLSEIKGRHINEVVVPEGAMEEAEMLDRKAKKGYVYNDTIRRRKDGSLIHVSISAAPIKIENNIAGYMGVYKDISRLKRTEEELKDSGERLKILFEFAPDAYYLNDLKGNFIDGNKAAEELTGYNRSELVGKSFLKLKLLSRRDILKAAKLLAKNAFGKPTGPDEFLLNRKDGTCVPVEIRTFPVKIKGQTLVLGIARDITERKKALDKLKALNEKLTVVGPLTRHDARNKLSAVTMNTFLAKQKLTENHEALQHLNEVESAVEQVEGIFDFARIYEKLGMEELTYMSVEKSFEESVSLFSDLKNTKVVNDCRGLTVLTDSLLRQLFYNLIDNSLKYGEKVSRIRVYYEEEGKDQLKLVYEDNGVGIPVAEKKKIFEEGYGKGTGYGLYLIRKMCEVYGWAIQETGKHGKGAQFTVTIPKMNESGRTNYKLH